MTSKAVKPYCSTLIDHSAAHTFCFDSAHAGFTALLTSVQVSEMAVGLCGPNRSSEDLCECSC